MNENTDIFICSHREMYGNPTDTVFKVVAAPNSNVETTLPLIRDNGAISNRGFSELSMFYYIWKNVDIKDYIGTAHYHRYFDFGGVNPTINIEDIFTKEGKDVILPMPFRCSSVRQQYNNNHNVKDLDLVQDIITSNYKDFKVTNFSTLEKLYTNNMFVMKKDDFNNYCEFVFGVLFEFCKERGIDPAKDESFMNFVANNYADYAFYNGGWQKIEYQARICAYLAERVGTIFFLNKFNNIKEVKLLTDFEGFTINKYEK